MSLSLASIVALWRRRPVLLFLESEENNPSFLGKEHSLVQTGDCLKVIWPIQVKIRTRIQFSRSKKFQDVSLSRPHGLFKKPGSSWLEKSSHVDWFCFKAKPIKCKSEIPGRPLPSQNPTKTLLALTCVDETDLRSDPHAERTSYSSACQLHTINAVDVCASISLTPEVEETDG